MKLRIDLKVLRYDHYNMDNNKGASLLVFGGFEKNNNGAGVGVSTMPLVDYNELSTLANIPHNQYPALFKADIQTVTIKNRTGKAVTGLSACNLEFVSSLELIPKK